MLVNVEQGATNPSIATLLRLSDALGIGLPALVDTADEAEDPVAVTAPVGSGDVVEPAGGSAVMVAGTGPPE